MAVFLIPRDHSRRCFFRSIGVCWEKALGKMVKEGKHREGILGRDAVIGFPLVFLLRIS